ncbi:MAG TPA: hypothetical protein VMS31_15870, partial [Pyrinomonadaceae bacterium]|nr:hypothetical protein [Pyrinomonadaceae bacterium]
QRLPYRASIPANSSLAGDQEVLMLPPLPTWPGGPHPGEIAAMQAMRAHLAAVQAGATPQQARTRHLLLLRR